MLRLSFSTGTLYHLPLRATFSLAHEAGFDAVELVLGPEVLVRGAAYVRRLSQEYGLPVISLHPPIVPIPGLGRPIPTLPRLLALAEEVRCGLIVLHPPKVVARDTSAWTEYAQALGGRHRNAPVRISVENPAIFRPSDRQFVLHDPRRLRDFADQHDVPVTFDTSHAGTLACGLLGAYDLLRGGVVSVHFSDLAARSIFPDWPPLYTFFLHHQMPGAGVLPLAAFVRRLVGDDFRGALTLEVSPTAIQAWSLSRIRQGLTEAIGFVRRAEGELANATAVGARTRAVQ